MQEIWKIFTMFLKQNKSTFSPLKFYVFIYSYFIYLNISIYEKNPSKENIE